MNAAPGLPDSAARKAFATTSETELGESISALNLVIGRNRFTVSISKLFCRVSLIERNAIPRDLDFQHQAALLLASPTSASGMMRVQPCCHEENRFATRRFRIASN